MANDVDTTHVATAVEGAKLDKQRMEDASTQGYGKTSSYQAPGRLGYPSMELGRDPRVNAKLKSILPTFGLDKFQPATMAEELPANASLEQMGAAIEQGEAAIMMLYNSAPTSLPKGERDQDVMRTEETIKGGNGQDMKLYIYRPASSGSSEPLPCIVYSHGGGMTMVQTMNPMHGNWCTSLAAQGALVVMTDFRNAWTKEAHNPFPTGLNDCAAAVKWIDEHRRALGIGNIILQGESGGGNLALATALKANREGWIGKIAGVYAMIPYISGGFGWSDERKLKEMPSMVENNGYLFNTHATAYLAHYYGPKTEDQTNPLAWPYFATVEDMKGLPPHILAMDELDPLRDEGVVYARRLAEAGVASKGFINLGVGHHLAMFMRGVMPEYWSTSAREVTAFAKSL